MTSRTKVLRKCFFSMTNGIINTDLTDDNIIRFMTHLAYKLFDFVA